MKLRSLGSGSSTCRHPLVPSCWLLQSAGATVVIGAPWQLAARLEAIGISLDQIDMILPLSPRGDQIGGLEEIAHYFMGKSKKPYLVAPEKLLQKIKERIEPAFLFYLKELFQVKAVSRIQVKEEHISETLSFVPNYLDLNIPSYGIRLEDAKIFITGETALNETWLFKEMGCNAILHSCNLSAGITGYPGPPSLAELQTLPVYLQNKLWLYGYGNAFAEHESQIIPMLFLPQGAAVYDSARRDKILNKERYLRENAKRLLGNEREP